MEVFPSEYQSLDLTRYEKLFVRHAISSEQYGFLLLKVNPAMIKNDSMNIVILSQGVVFCKFFDGFDDAAQFSTTMGAYVSYVYPTTRDVISQKLLSNKTICDGSSLKFAASIIHVFPNLKKADIVGQSLPADVKHFVENNCL